MEKKRMFIPCIIVILICITGYAVYNLRLFQTTSSKRLPNLYEGAVEPYISEYDMDGDGIDDQTDILESAVSYIETKPKYKSKYYTSGYSDDKYGVCTDVVANALSGAGYDLRDMVYEDISANLQEYDITEPDKNIDFRRVRNLKVFFDNNAISLTTDIYDIEEWQGGDIVIFEKHIGIVSDRRNGDGVTYVIHHNDPLQKSYEEDILETRSDIVGHYRMSGNWK